MGGSREVASWGGRGREQGRELGGGGGVESLGGGRCRRAGEGSSVEGGGGGEAGMEPGSGGEWKGSRYWERKGRELGRVGWGEQGRGVVV